MLVKTVFEPKLNPFVTTAFHASVILTIARYYARCSVFKEQCLLRSALCFNEAGVISYQTSKPAATLNDFQIHIDLFIACFLVSEAGVISYLASSVHAILNDFQIGSTLPFPLPCYRSRSYIISRGPFACNDQFLPAPRRHPPVGRA
jgi:hypothetical protein